MIEWPLSVELTLGLVNSLAIIITLAILIWQTRELTKQTKELRRSLELNAIQDMTEKLYRVYEIMIDKPHLAKAVGSKVFTTEKAFTYLVLDLYEMAYKQYKKGILDIDDWNAWLRAIDDSFKSEIFEEHWVDAKKVLSQKFVQYIEKRINNKSQSRKEENGNGGEE